MTFAFLSGTGTFVDGMPDLQALIFLVIIGASSGAYIVTRHFDTINALIDLFQSKK